MSKKLAKLIILSLILAFGSGIFVFSAQAGNRLNLEVKEECDIKYGGDNCVAKLELNNTTGDILSGKGFLLINYNNNLFDGEGITSDFSINDKKINFSNWDNGIATVSGFDINENRTYLELSIKTALNLYPGEYTYTFTIEGISEEGETYTASVSSGGGGGGYTINNFDTTNNSSGIATTDNGLIITLVNPDGSGVKLVVPPGAVSKDTKFTIKKVDSDLINPIDFKKGLFFVNGLFFEITAERDGKVITSFDKFLELTFMYVESQIRDFEELSFQISWWNGNEWIVIENDLKDIGEKTVTASIDHLSLFLLAGYKNYFFTSGTTRETSYMVNTGAGDTGNLITETSENNEKIEEQLLNEPDLTGIPASLLTAAAIFTLGTGKNIVSIAILILIFSLFAFLYDKYFRKSKK